MFFPARVAADAWVGPGGDRPRDVGLPDQGDETLHGWCWEAGRGCLWATADEMASLGVEQGRLRGTE
jgi:hypothetical protein